MSIPGLILSIYLTYKIIKELNRLNNAKMKLRRVIYIISDDDAEIERPTDEEKGMWMWWRR